MMKTVDSSNNSGWGISLYCLSEPHIGKLCHYPLAPTSGSYWKCPNFFAPISYLLLSPFNYGFYSYFQCVWLGLAALISPEYLALLYVFQIKEDMRLAPIQRSQITSDQIAKLDLCLSHPSKEPSTPTYLEALRTKEYMKGSSKRTWPRKKAKDVENDVEVIGMYCSALCKSEVGNSFRCHIL